MKVFKSKKSSPVFSTLSVSELVSLGKRSVSNRDWATAERYLFEAHCKEIGNSNIHNLLAHVRHQYYLSEPIKQQVQYVSSPLKELSNSCGMKMHVTNLVFQGGGIKGIAYTGAMEEFQQCVNLKSVVRVGGSSAGGIASLLFGLGFTIEELAHILKKVNWTLLMDGEFAKTFLEMQQHKAEFTQYASHIAQKETRKLKWFDFLRALLVGKPYSKELRQGLATLTKQLGLFPGDFFREGMLEKVIQQRTGIVYLTFLELHELRAKYPEQNYRDIYFVATNISSQEVKIFSWETTPDAIISDALRCSISIPFVFTPHQQYIKVNGQRVPDPSGHLYVDGSVMENYPIWLFDKAKYLPEIPPAMSPEAVLVNPHTLGFKLVNRETQALYDMFRRHVTDTQKIEDIAEYLTKLFMVVASREESQYSLKVHDQLRTVYIYDSGIETTEFNLDESKLDMLIENGRKGFQLFVKKRLLEHGSQRIRELIIPRKQPDYVYNMFASYEPHQAIEYLRQGDICVDEKDEEGNTALHLCALLDDVTTCRKLMGVGVDVSIRNYAGKTACDIAAVFQSKKVLQLLGAS